MKKITFCIGAACLALAGCAGHPSSAIPATGGLVSHPQVVQTAKVPISWTQLAWGDTVQTPSSTNAIVVGADKNMWYTDYYGMALFRMTMTGKTTKFALTFNPTGMVVGADGKFYIASTTSGVMAVVTTSGAVSNKAIPSGDRTYYGQPGVGPDKNVWFPELSHIGKITTGGAITEMPYPDGNTNNYSGAAATGPDGTLWVTESNAYIVDSVETDTGNITSYPLPCSPTGLLPGPDGNMWIFCSGTALRMTPGGAYTSFTVPFANFSYPEDITVGPDKQLWFTSSGLNIVSEFNVNTFAVTMYFPPSTYGTTYGIEAGPDGNIWALDSTKMVDVYIPNPLTVSPTSIAFHVSNQQTLTVTENGTAAWTAVSSSPGVATVVQGAQPNLFTVTAVGLGSTNVTISDGKGNTFVVKVKVS